MIKSRCSPILYCLRLMLCFLLVGLVSCASHRSSEFQLSKDDYIAAADEKPSVYVTGTKPLDSANLSKLLVDVWKIESESYPKEIRAYVRVLDSSGNFITNMADPHYRGSGDYHTLWSGIRERLGNKDTAIKDFSVREYSELDSIPYALVLAMDHGGSMGGTIESLQDAADMFIGLKRSYDKLALVKFDRKAVVEVPLTSDKNEIRQKFKKNGLEGFGLYTSLFDAAKESMLLLKNIPPESPRILVLFTDGEDNSSKTTEAELLRLADSLNVHIFPVGFGYTNDTTMHNLADFTGGKYYKAFKRDQLFAIFKDIYLSLRNFYRITYVPPVYEGLHQVQIDVTPPGGTSLLARGEYDKPVISIRTPLDSPFVRPILFDFAKATIRPESAPILDEMARALKRFPRVMLAVHGHTDNVGGEEFNQKLSEQRAEAVVQALVDRGIDRMRFRPRGFGMTQPIAPNDTEANKQKNRRTEFVVLRQ